MGVATFALACAVLVACDALTGGRAAPVTSSPPRDAVGLAASEAVEPIDLSATQPVTIGVSLADPPPGFGGAGTAAEALAVFSPAAGRPRTGSLEGVIEAVLRGGSVVVLGGHNSAIPHDGVVVAGTGVAEQWMRTHLRPGAAAWIAEGRLHARPGVRQHLERVEAAVAAARRTVDAGRTSGAADERQVARATAHLKAGDDELVLARAALTRPDAAGEKRALTLLGSVLARAELAAAMVTPTRADEPRLVWYRLDRAASPAIVRGDVERLSASGFTGLIIDVFYDGRTVFPTARSLLSQHEEHRGWDPLTETLVAAQRVGLSVHAAFSVFGLGTSTNLRILAEQPGWLALSAAQRTESALDGGSRWLSPASAEARDWLLANIRDFATQYGVRGIHLYDVRHPLGSGTGRDFDFSAAARTAFIAAEGVDPMELDPNSDGATWQRFTEFRRDRITSIVQEVRRELKRVKPELELSVSVATNLAAARDLVFQDWPLWAEGGLVDWMCLPVAEEGMVVMRRGIAEALPPEFRAVAGITLPEGGEGPRDLVAAIVAAREAGARGIVVMNPAALSARALQMLRLGPFRSGTRIAPSPLK